MIVRLIPLIPLTRHEDDRGYLYEVIHQGDMARPFAQAYVVCSPVRGTVRAFHKHRELWDYFCVISGSACFQLAQDDDPHRLPTRFILTARTPQLLGVPPETWHGWEALEDNTIVLCAGTQLYDQANPDEVRIAADAFGPIWGIRAR